MRVLLQCLLVGLILSTSGLVRAQDQNSEDGGVNENISADAGVSIDGSPAASGTRNHSTETTRPIEPERLPQVRASISNEQVELGEAIQLTITISAQPGDRVHLRDRRRFGDFELLGRPERREVTDSTQGDGPQPSEMMELRLITFETGQLEIPPIELMVVLSDGRTGTVSTESIPLRVTDPLGNENDPEPRVDHAPRPVLTTDRRALWVGGFLVALLLAALFGAVVGQIRARRKPKPIPPPPPPRPPEEIALEKLDAIRRSPWLEEGEIKNFHIAVSEAVREYLGGRYGFDSLEMTTEELTAQLEIAALRGVTMIELERFLRDTDLVKFAKWRPSVEMSRELLDRAFDIVRRTTEAQRAWEIKSSMPKKSRDDAQSVTKSSKDTLERDSHRVEEMRKKGGDDEA